MGGQLARSAASATGGVRAFGVVRFAFTDRHGGVSAAPYQGLNLGGHVGDDPAAVAENRRRAAGRLGLAEDRVVWMSQVHGTEVALVTGAVDPPPVADALVTTTGGLAVAVLVADCTPVLLADPQVPVVAAVHAGRAGMADGVVPAALERMRACGARPERIVAVTGPAACGRCYEVPAELAAAVAARVPAARSRTRAGSAGLDVAAGVWAQLAAAGVRQGEQSTVCTITSSDHYSYRREGRTGRFAGYAWIEPHPAGPVPTDPTRRGER